MMASTDGRYGYPTISNDDPMEGPDQITAAAGFWDDLLGQQVDTLDDLPDTSERPPGHPVWVVSTSALYVNTSSGWVVLVGALRSFTPTVSGLTVGAGGSVLYAQYSIAAGSLNLRVGWQLGTSGFTVGDIILDPPVPIASGSADLSPLGTVVFVDVSAGATGRRLGVVMQSTTSLRLQFHQVNGSGVQASATTATAPFTWAAGDQILLMATYPI